MSLTCKELTILDGTTLLVNIAFSFERSFALIGQSGSGKSLSLKALLGMLPSGLQSRCVCEASYPLVRGESIAFVPQNPFTALSPLTLIYKQFTCSFERAQGYLAEVELPSSVLKRFPSELSGGELQRVIIAMALSIEPKLILLDEPTTALDETNKGIVLALLKRLHHAKGFDMLFVTHDTDTIEGVCEEVGILENGVMVEKGAASDVLHHPHHPYTRALLASGFFHRSFRT